MDNKTPMMHTTVAENKRQFGSVGQSMQKVVKLKTMARKLWRRGR